MVLREHNSQDNDFFISSMGLNPADHVPFIEPMPEVCNKNIDKSDLIG